MLKFEIRKLATVIIALMAVGMLAACSGSSSTDEPLTSPGDNALTTVRFDVDPGANSVTVTPVASPYSTNPIYGDGAGTFTDFTISTANITGGATAFDVSINYTGTDFLNNVRLGVNSSTDLTVSLDNSDKCAGPWAGCLPGNDPAISYVSDDIAQGGTTWIACDPTVDPPDCTFPQVIAEMVPGCALNTKNWQITASTQFSFWATLYGDLSSPDITLDGNYDPGTAIIYAEPRAYGGQNAEGPPTVSVPAGTWFYLHAYVDYPGNNRPLPFDTTDAGITKMEDTGNIAAWANGSDPYADYWYMQYIGVGIRFDPAVIQVNSSIGTADPPGNGLFSFPTLASEGTGGVKLKMLTDPNGTTDMMDYAATANQASILASNMMGVYKQQNSAPIVPVTSFYANPCGPFDVDPNNCAGFPDSLANIDFNLWFVPIKAKDTAGGMATSFRGTYNDMTLLIGSRTMGLAYAPGGGSVNVPRSGSWTQQPNDLLPRSALPADGVYNLARSYVCVQ